MNRNPESRKARKHAKAQPHACLDPLSQAGLPRDLNRHLNSFFARPKGVSRFSRFHPAYEGTR